MRIHDVVQGSPEWIARRLGKPTASGADKFLTPSKREPSKQRFAYRIELLTEWLLGVPLEDGSTGWMDRGRMLEPEAASWYALTKDVDLGVVGFVERDDGLVGCSPDRLVGDRGLLEIKCLAAANHVRALLGEDAHEHYGQVQFQMMICEREWCDILHYNPVLRPVVNRIPRDDIYIRALVDVLDPFVEQLEKDKLRLAEYRVT